LISAVQWLSALKISFVVVQTIYKTNDPPHDPLQFHNGNGNPFKSREWGKQNRYRRISEKVAFPYRSDQDKFLLDDERDVLPKLKP
jgi:hypothetical protein